MKITKHERQAEVKNNTLWQDGNGNVYLLHLMCCNQHELGLPYQLTSLASGYPAAIDGDPREVVKRVGVIPCDGAVTLEND
jgi:hypothetical protein